MTHTHLYTHTHTSLHSHTHLIPLKMMRLYYLICIPIEKIDYFFEDLNIRTFSTYDDYFGDDTRFLSQESKEEKRKPL